MTQVKPQGNLKDPTTGEFRDDVVDIVKDGVMKGKSKLSIGTDLTEAGISNANSNQGKIENIDRVLKSPEYTRSIDNQISLIDRTLKENPNKVENASFRDLVNAKCNLLKVGLLLDKNYEKEEKESLIVQVINYEDTQSDN